VQGTESNFGAKKEKGASASPSLSQKYYKTYSPATTVVPFIKMKKPGVYPAIYF
jgi:hypothetical protein